ncbi:MAG TPA: 6,7-dimethyl-8-ribityllumazine synthase [Phycisphaerae bacterium]|nr:6,7-dimethyl-8-ribityllumazine synthase [Phycisphaerales bacterium]HRX84156.1 6,7-dimethyl-8-ribityllumazine synthase [Phycisphaerae bacterium]
MPKTIEGALTVSGQKFAIVVSRFNDFITAKLVGGAVDTLVRHGGRDEDITVIHVPGAFEIPAAARRAAGSKAYDAVICLGCVIRGQTPHFEYVAAQASRGIAEVAMTHDVPVTFGLITADTLEQAIERAGSKAGNKGADAAASAIEMVNVLGRIP